MPTQVTAATRHIVSLPEVREHLNVPATDVATAAELDVYRLAAQGHVESRIGPVLWQDVTRMVYPVYGAVVLPVWPVVSVVSVTDTAGAPVTGWRLDQGAGVVSGLPAGAVTVAWVAGRTTLPDEVRAATLLCVEQLWRTQRGVAPSALPDAQGLVYEPSLGRAFALPAVAIDLLAPHMPPPGLA